MVINVNNTYEKMISLYKRQGARIRYDKEFASAAIEWYFDTFQAELYLDTDMATLCQMTDTDAEGILRDWFKVEATPEILDLFGKLEFVEKGDCPECGGWLEHTDDECDEGDHRGEYYVTAIYDCPLCGNRVREYDAEATREGRDMRETYNSLMH